MKDINLTINGKQICAPEGSTLVEAARGAGIEIPTLCYRKELQPFTSCFICVVEIKGARKLEPACSTFVVEGMDVLTNSKEVRATRKLCLELLLSEHDGDCISPCAVECPAGCNIQGYVNAIAEGDFKKANDLIQKTISIPSSVARICPRPCEAKCRRSRKENPVSICSLKRFVGDASLDKEDLSLPEKMTDKKVAIIGAGPSGLNAAYFLRKAGYDVTIFEAQAKAGGMLQYGIPEYRLPKKILQQEIENIIKLGVDIRYNTKIGKDITFEDLKAEGFEAFLFAIGAWKAASMHVPGEHHAGVMSGIELLAAVESDKHYQVGGRVIVIGGGNTAIDAARTCVRLGADVTMLYRRTRCEMPAESIEVEAAIEEGVEIEFLTAPLKIEAREDKLQLQCIKMQLGEPDEGGRHRPVAIEGSEFELDADMIVSAIGQKIEASYFEALGLALNESGTVTVEKNTYQTNIPGVFAAGDCISGPYIATAAIGTGRRAAIAMDQYLRGEKVVGEKTLFKSSMGSLEDIPEDFYADIEEVKRNKMPELPPKQRIENFEEVELGFGQADAIKEAERCLKCGCQKSETCTLRDLASEYCVEPERLAGEKKAYLVDKSHSDIIFESNKCILCGCCIRYCNEIAKEDVLGFVNRGFDTVVRPAFEKPLSSIKFSCGKKLAEVCPTGAISLLTFNHGTSAKKSR